MPGSLAFVGAAHYTIHRLYTHHTEQISRPLCGTGRLACGTSAVALVGLRLAKVTWVLQLSTHMLYTSSMGRSSSARFRLSPPSELSKRIALEVPSTFNSTLSLISLILVSTLSTMLRSMLLPVNL